MYDIKHNCGSATLFFNARIHSASHQSDANLQPLARLSLHAFICEPSQPLAFFTLALIRILCLVSSGSGFYIVADLAFVF